MKKRKTKAKIAESTINVNLGNAIRSARKKCGFSLHKLGTMIGISYQQMQKYEKGSNNLSVDKLCRIGDIYQAEETTINNKTGEVRFIYW